MAIDREELSEAEDAIVRTLYELVSNLSGAEVQPIRDHMEARFPWLDASRVAAAPAETHTPVATAPVATEEAESGAANS